MTFLFFQGHRLLWEKNCHRYISTSTICFTSILIPVVHMMKLKVKLKKDGDLLLIVNVIHADKE